MLSLFFSYGPNNPISFLKIDSRANAAAIKFNEASNVEIREKDAELWVWHGEELSPPK